MRTPQAHAPAIISVIVFILMRFRPFSLLPGISRVHLPDLWINKFWPLRHLFATHLIDPVYDDCSMKKQPISTAVVLEFRELWKWITKWYWNLSELYECKHICHRDRFIFYITLWVFHNASKSKLLTLIKNNSYVQLFYKLSLSYSQFATNGSTSLLNENF